MNSITKYLLYLLFLYFRVALAEFGLVEASETCKVHCMNHGVCVYRLDNPSKHSCICLQGSFYGEFCQYSEVIFGALEDTGIHDDNELDDDPHTVGGLTTEPINDHIFDKVIPVDSEEEERANRKKVDEEPVMVSVDSRQPQTDEFNNPVVTNFKKDENKGEEKVAGIVEQNLAYADNNYIHTYHSHNRLQYKTLSEKSVDEIDANLPDSENGLESESSSWMMARKPREFNICEKKRSAI
uniref:EGF-like domain-containing protein n=1 Tax=Syphacia muris TaxID=451379 RepID=A0A0N5AB90_9BILA